ncbi:TPA: hypothetical protein KQE56_001247 [Clostridioides difficile]|uniref:Uncharacterized protein n=1 Tax=Clostridioides difficile TaxID=1496 RepID=A0AB74QE89_CLODI|nr:hypothetical protein [Clostridioides difficile]VFD33557.1 Uncharacterised protein [Clostridioides difficile]VHP84289.1 Uncharacterised protein [Clostridioides difficile]HBE8487624.1 hypothetical protein [Clostridioides difficile]HBF3542582.1 hypothetical protein [Clostridioides difficile]HBF4990815.1 hypothetical protein [Clostridioides difficile]
METAISIAKGQIKGANESIKELKSKENYDKESLRWWEGVKQASENILEFLEIESKE